MGWCNIQNTVCVGFGSCRWICWLGGFADLLWLGVISVILWCFGFWYVVCVLVFCYLVLVCISAILVLSGVLVTPVWEYGCLLVGCGLSLSVICSVRVLFVGDFGFGGLIDTCEIVDLRIIGTLLFWDWLCILVF